MTAHRVLAAAVLALVLSACASAVPGRATADADAVLPAGVEPVTISAEAADALGRDGVNAAYAVATTMTSTFSYQEDLLRLSVADARAEDFEGITEYLRRGLAEDYLDDVGRMLNGDTDADGRVTSLQLWALVGPGVELVDPPAVGQYTVTGASAELPDADVDGVELRFTESAVLTLTQDGAPGTSTLEKTVELLMVPADGGPHPWLLADYSATLDIGEVVLD